MNRLAAAFAAFLMSAVSCAADDVGRGRHTAQQLCAGCHLLEGHGGQDYQGVYVRSFPDIAARYGRTREALKEVITFPHRPMPGLPLGPSEIDDLAAFIHSLNSTRR